MTLWMYGGAKSQMSLYKLTFMDRQTDRNKKQLLGARDFALPKNNDVGNSGH